MQRGGGLAVTTPIAEDRTSWFDGLRPDQPWQPPDHKQPQPPAPGGAPRPGETTSEFVQRIGLGGMRPSFGEDQQD